MERALLVRIDWDRTAIPLREAKKYYTLHVGPEAEFPFGRKGLALAGAWKQLATPGCAGMLILDGDVAIDPHDTTAMLTAIQAEPEAVHAAPVKLWPASTKRDGCVWGHGRGDFSTEDPDDPDLFGFSFTYLPRKLIEASIKAGLPEWSYPNVDRMTRKTAQQMKLPVRVVRQATPKHLNY